MPLLSRTALLLAVILSVACNGSGDDSDTDSGTERPGESAFLTSIFPADGSADVWVDASIEVTFTTAVAAGERAISLRREGTAVRIPVVEQWLNDGTVLVATPESPLLFDAQYTVEIDESVQSGNPEGDDFGQAWTFFTEQAPAASLTSSFPAHQSEENSVFIDITGTFDTAIDPESVTAASAYLVDAINSDLPYGDLSVSGDTITFSPTSPLAADTLYTMVFTTGIEDVAGVPLGQDVEVTFGTVDALRFQTTLPAADASNVPIEQSIVLTFTQDIDASLINNESLGVQVNDLFNNVWFPELPGSVTVAANTLTFIPAGGTWQEFKTNHTVRVNFDSVRGVNGEPFQGLPVDVTTEMVSPNWTYHLLTEGSGRNQFMQTYSAPQTVFMGPDDTSSSRWSFSPRGGETYGMRTDYGGVDLWLEGSDGTGIATMQTGGNFTGQLWRFASYGGHPSSWNQQGFESPSIYYMETVFQGDDRALTMVAPAGTPVREGRMADQTGSIHSLFWLKRMSPAPF
jgi:hypothetical protein